MSLLAVDLGGTFLRCGVAQDDGTIVAIKRSRIKNFLDVPSSDEVWESILSDIADYARDVDDLLDPADPIIFSFPGPVKDESTIVSAPTVVGAEAVIPDLASLLEARARRPVRILNDISAAAWYLGEQLRVERFRVSTLRAPCIRR